MSTPSSFSRATRAATLAALLGAAGALWTGPAAAVPDAQTFITGTCGRLSSADSFIVPGTASFSCDETFTNSGHGAQVVGRAMTSGGQAPQAEVTMDASVDQPLGFVNVSGNLIAQLDYYVGLTQIAAPPTRTIVVPLAIHLEAHLSLVGHGSGSVRAEIDGFQAIDRTASTFTPGGDDSLTLSRNIAVGGQIHVRKRAQCSVLAGFYGGGSILAPQTSCDAVVDPAFDFDQLAFDALMGPDSFPLADYFMLEMSASLVQAEAPPEIPAPPAAALLATALALFAALRRAERADQPGRMRSTRASFAGSNGLTKVTPESSRPSWKSSVRR